MEMWPHLYDGDDRNADHNHQPHIHFGCDTSSVVAVVVRVILLCQDKNQAVPNSAQINDQNELY